MIATFVDKVTMFRVPKGRTYVLSELPLDVEAEIVRLERSPLTVRLLEMGCLPGSRVRKYVKLGKGNRMVIEISGMLLALREEEARIVIVRSHE